MANGEHFINNLGGCAEKAELDKIYQPNTNVTGETFKCDMCEEEAEEAKRSQKWQ